MISEKWIFWLEELGQEHNDLVGKKSANLGEITKMGLPVPPGFALSLGAFEKFLIETKAGEEIEEFLHTIHNSVQSIGELEASSSVLRQLVESKEIPGEMAKTITSYYEQLIEKCGLSDLPVSIRSAGAVSHPGQYETYLNVRGRPDLLKNIIKVWSSAFNLRSLASQMRKGQLLEMSAIGVCVLKMVNARSAGVAFTADPNTGDTSKIICEANWGLGESIVDGGLVPDTYVLNKHTLKIVEKRLGEKTKMVNFHHGGVGVAEEEIQSRKASVFCLSDEEVKEIGRLGKEIEAHFDNVPQDIEWAVDADLAPPHNIILLQTRPATIAKRKSAVDQALDLMVNRLYSD